MYDKRRSWVRILVVGAAALVAILVFVYMLYVALVVFVSNNFGT